MISKILRISPDSLANKFTNEAYSWIVHFGPRLLLTIILFFVGELLIRVFNRILRGVLSGKRFKPTLIPFVENFVNIVLQVLLVFLLMQALGIKLTLFAALIGSFGVAAGLALSGTMQNFAGGVLIILLKPYIVGDNIITQGKEGTVTSIRLFYTVILTFSNTTVIVPNSKLWNDVIFNLTRERKRRLDISLKFKYAVAFNEVKNIVLKTIDAFEGGLTHPPSRVGIEKIETDGYTVCINTWVNSHGFEDTKLQFNETLMNSLKDVFMKT